MFNGDLKKEALKRLEKTNNQYIKKADQLTKLAQSFMEVRRVDSLNVISEIENYINQLVNSPKEFDKSFTEYHVTHKCFEKELEEVGAEAEKVDIDASIASGAGVATGVGVAALAPTAAMAVATTFGTASTGAAITSLSGAAATNAALAWLGGGALAAGGGGMAAGNALLALAGPIGWTIGGAALVGGGLFARKKNKEIAEDADKQTRKITKHISNLDSGYHRCNKLKKLTQEHIAGSRQLLQNITAGAPDDYMQFNTEQKNSLVALINHVSSLNELLQTRLDEK